MTDVDGPRLVRDEAEFGSAMDLVDRAFNNPPGGMERESPHSFDPGHPERHAVVRVDGEVVSHVGCTPQTLVVDGEELSAWGITGVATDRRHRGEGYMSDLMTFWLDRMDESDAAITDLYGDRTRYASFGYELAGRQVSYDVDERSLDRAEYDPADVTELDASSDDLAPVRRLHERERLRVRRDPEEYRTLLERGSLGLLHYDDGDEAAYLVFGRTDTHRHVPEFGGSEAGVRALLTYLFDRYDTDPIPTYGGAIGGSGVGVTAPATHPLTDGLARHASSWQVEPHQMVRIVDLERTLAGFTGQIHRRWERVVGGRRSVTLAIAGADPVRLSVGPDAAAVETVPGTAADVERDRLEMTRLLFGFPDAHPVSREEGLLSAVLPLDFYVWGTETV